MKKGTMELPQERIASRIFTIRGKKVMLAIFLSIGVLVVILLFVGRSSFFGIGLEEDKAGVDENTAPNILDIPALYDPTTATTVSTTGWKTYNKQQYGFSFEYPSTYEIKTYPPEKAETLFSLDLVPEKKEAAQQTFSISIRSDAVANIVGELMNFGIENVSVKDISLNGLSGKLVQSEYGFTGDLENHVVFEDSKKQVIYIYYPQYTGNNSPMLVPNSTFDTILQSIRLYR